MKKANPAAVGAFVLGAIALLLAGVVALGSGAWLRDTVRYVLFFDGSVNGLTVGAPVKIRGVEVGSVLEVNSLADTTRMDVLNEVVIEIDPQRFKRVGPAVSTRERAQLLVEQGLRARLETESLVTGQLYVGFDFHPDVPIKLLGLDERYPELPTMPSVGQEVSDTVRGLVARIQRLPLEDIVRSVDQAASGIAHLVNSPDLQAAVSDMDETVADARAVLVEARGVLAEADRLVADLDARVGTVADSAVGALDQARDTLASLDSAVQPDSEVRYQLTLALEELVEAARAVRLLADYVERNPSSLVFGRPPQEER